MIFFLRATTTAYFWQLPVGRQRLTRISQGERDTSGMGNRMRRVVKYVLVAVAVLLCLATALFQYSVYRDRKNFSEAKNACERGCIQDSGGFPHCREVCAAHLDHYP